MGRGSSRGGGGGLNPADIVDTVKMSWTSTASQPRTQAEQDFFDTAGELYNTYGNDVIPQDFFLVATLKGRAQNGVIAYYDGSNIGLNEKFMDTDYLESAYAQAVRQGFHPSNGNRSAASAVAAHEMGHRITDAVGQRMGINDLTSAADRIVTEARQRNGKHRGNIQFGSAISGYAKHSNAETIAEAFADYYCNGSNARAESRAVVGVINGYLR